MRRPLLEESSSSSCLSVETPSTSSSTLALSTVTQMTRLSLQDESNIPQTGPRSCSFSIGSNISRKKIQPRSSSRPKWRSSTESSLASSSGSSRTGSHQFSPFDVRDDFGVPNAEPEDMASCSDLIIDSPSKSGFFEKIKTVFRPRVGSKSSVQSVKTNCSNSGEDLGENWVAVYYYEYSERIGEVYESSCSEFCITGNNERSNNYSYNLGNVQKPNRTPGLQKIRFNIGDGVRFYNKIDGIYVDNRSSHPAFIQAPVRANQRGDHLTTVYRLLPGHGFIVFPSSTFEYMTSEAQKEGPEAVQALKQLCRVRVSFGKGWGDSYRIRYALGLPVWVEILFIAAMDELDDLVLSLRRLQNSEVYTVCETDVLEETEEELTNFSDS